MFTQSISTDWKILMTEGFDNEISLSELTELFEPSSLIKRNHHYPILVSPQEYDVDVPF